MKRVLAAFALAVVAADAHAAVPSIVDGSVVMTPGRKKVSVTYRLEGAPGIVTMDVQTNRGDDVWVSIGGAAFAAGLSGDVGHVVDKDADDLPYFPEQNAEFVNLVLDKSIKIWTDRTICWSADRDGYGAVELQQIFEEGRGLFLGEVMQLVFRLRTMDIDFGLIPFPKYDSNQQNYGHFVHQTTALLSIPVSTKDYVKIGAFVEAMAYESMYTLTPAYYETALNGKYFRDPESSEMLDIILQSRTFDLGSTHMFDWGGIGSVFTGLLSKGSNAYASTYQKKIKAAKTKLSKEIAKILKDT